MRARARGSIIARGCGVNDKNIFNSEKNFLFRENLFCSQLLTVPVIRVLVRVMGMVYGLWLQLLPCQIRVRVRVRIRVAGTTVPVISLRV